MPFEIEGHSYVVWFGIGVYSAPEEQLICVGQLGKLD